MLPLKVGVLEQSAERIPAIHCPLGILFNGVPEKLVEKMTLLVTVVLEEAISK